MSDRTEYGLRFALDSHVPCVQVLVGEQVVKTVYGLTAAHALKRALRWMSNPD